MIEGVQRQPAEQKYERELAALREVDDHPRPDGWRLSPLAIRDFILGRKNKLEGVRVEKKIFGNDPLVERSIATLIGQRGLLLAGEPGTAKSLLSELLAAAISGTSTLTVQGGAGTVEEGIRYSWNYAALLNSGPSLDALVPGPLYTAMDRGALLRFEEITRCPTEVQDSLISVISDRILHIPELKDERESTLLSRPGFNVIATANLRDRGTNDMSAALKRRFNFETMQPLTRHNDQVALVRREVERQLEGQSIGVKLDSSVIDVVVTAFNEMRAGAVDGTRIDPPTAVLSTAEMIGVTYSAAVERYYFDNAPVRPSDISRHLVGVVIKDDEADVQRFRDYVRIVKRKRGESNAWADFAKLER
ncbi:MAG: AAA family ATPase [Pseudomonadota bacterium]